MLWHHMRPFERARAGSSAENADLERLKELFPQIEASILLETLHDEGSYDGAVNSLLRSLVHSLTKIKW